MEKRKAMKIQRCSYVDTLPLRKLDTKEFERITREIEMAGGFEESVKEPNLDTDTEDDIEEEEEKGDSNC